MKKKRNPVDLSNVYSYKKKYRELQMSLIFIIIMLLLIMKNKI